MKFVTGYIWFSLLLFILNDTAFAQQRSSDFVAAEGTTVRQLVSRMLADNSEIAAARLRVEQAQARLVQAGLRPNPVAEFQQKRLRIAGEGDQEDEFILALPLEIGGRRGSRLDAAKVDIERVRSESESLELQRITELELLVDQALSEVSRLQVLEGMASLNDQLQSASLLRVSSGDGSRYETSQVQAEGVRLNSERIRAGSNISSMLLQIRTLAGIPIGDPLQLRVSEFDFVPAPPPAFDDAVKIALEQRPDLLAARLAVAAAEANLRVARTSATPAVGASVGLKHVTVPGLIPEAEWLITGGASISLPFFNRNQGQIQEQALAVRETQLVVKDLEEKVRRDVAIALARLDQAHRNQDLYDRTLAPIIRESTRMAKLGFDMGELRFADFIADQRRAADIESGRIQTRAEVIQASVELERAMGRSPNR